MEPAGRISEELRIKNVKIDVKDKRILALLAENARIPLSQIAKKVQLSRDAIDYRIKRLQREGVIIRFFPVIDLKRFGYYIFHVFFLIDEMNRDKQVELLDFLKNHPHIRNIIEYSDRWDLEISIIAHDIDEFDEISQGITQRFPQLILEKENMQIIKGYHSIHLPKSIQHEINHVSLPQEERFAQVRLDEIDLAILRELAKNCRTSPFEIAKLVDLTGDAINYRIRRMLESGVIRYFTILTNLSALGFHWYTFSMQMKTFTSEFDRKLKEYVSQHHYIIRAVKTLGVWDLMLYVVADSPKHFHSTVKELKVVFSDVIRNHQTLLGYMEHRFDPLPAAVEIPNQERRHRAGPHEF
ncbi:MAG: winged helix-turn-helix transcriptional regulator [archaeon]